MVNKAILFILSTTNAVLLGVHGYGCLCSVGPLKGQISLTRSIQSLPYVLPSVPRKHVDMPKGLTMRNIPFGAGK